MNKYINIEIDLKYGNDAMQTDEQAIEALKEAVNKITMQHQQVLIRDLNGNKIGSVYVTTTEEK